MQKHAVYAQTKQSAFVWYSTEYVFISLMTINYVHLFVRQMLLSNATCKWGVQHAKTVSFLCKWGLYSTKALSFLLRFMFLAILHHKKVIVDCWKCIFCKNKTNVKWHKMNLFYQRNLRTFTDVYVSGARKLNQTRTND